MFVDLLDIDEYHARDGVSSSVLRTVHERSLLHAKHAPLADSPVFDIGSAAHTAILEPHLYETRYHCGPDDRRGHKWTQAVEEACDLGKKCLTSKQYNAGLDMGMIVGEHPDVLAYTRQASAVAERSYFHTADDGMIYKCRPDLWIPDTATVIDIKSTTDASPAAFRRSVMTYGYHIQEAWYRHVMHLEGIKVDRFIFLVVEKTDPYAFAFYELYGDPVWEALNIAKRAIEKWRTAVDTGIYSGYPSTPVTIAIIGEYND